MRPKPSDALSHDPENAIPYNSLSDQPVSSIPKAARRRSRKLLAGISLTAVLLLSLILLIPNNGQENRNQVSGDGIGMSSPFTSVSPESLGSPSRGVSQGVSEKSFSRISGKDGIFPWTNAMLSWQRTAYHFQPRRNWMNDPNGPLFYKGWYHLFYQYNPDSAIWGNITWGHAVSKDLIRWLHLPFAMVPDSPFDINGVWTGSATILPDGQIVMLYTGDTNDFMQVQNLAYPANLSDPLLLEWIKYSGNPVLTPPHGIHKKDFRDPTTAWLGPDGKWLITIGSKINRKGISLVYRTDDFKSYELLEGILHGVPGTGMWECVDFYPVSTVGANGLDTSTNGPGIKHVLKASLDDDKNDYYAIGTYNPIKNKWIPDNSKLDVGIGLRYDYGKYYASKTFYDEKKQRRILWGWTGETDSEIADLLKGWASVQTVPRTVVFDKKTGSHLLQWPIEELNSLRLDDAKEYNGVNLEPGSIVPLKVGSSTQLDIVASFEVDKNSLDDDTLEANAQYSCSSSGGAARRGALGPFGVVVAADETLSELTPVYFYVAKGIEGKVETHFCTDALRSSKATDVGKQVYGSTVPVLLDEKYSMRLLVDHSIVESFSQGGRTVITSRIYPTRATYGAGRVYLFNNATTVRVTASVKIWQLGSADIGAFPL